MAICNPPPNQHLPIEPSTCPRCVGVRNTSEDPDPRATSSGAAQDCVLAPWCIAVSTSGRARQQPASCNNAQRGIPPCGRGESVMRVGERATGPVACQVQCVYTSCVIVLCVVVGGSGLVSLYARTSVQRSALYFACIIYVCVCFILSHLHPYNFELAIMRVVLP